MAPTLRLHYFDIKGRAEATRLAFTLGDVAFEDVRVTPEEFGAQKASGALPFGQLPVLEIGGKKVAQSGAMLRYAGRLSHTYPEDPEKALLVDEILGAVEDVTQATVPSLREPDEQKKMQLRETLAREVYPRWLGIFSKKLEENGTGYFVGDSLTIADLQAYSTLSWISSGVLDGIPASILDPFPAIKAFLDKVASNPKIAAWNEAHKK